MIDLSRREEGQRMQVVQYPDPSGDREQHRCNSDLIGMPIDPIPTSEQYALFRKYIDARHYDGGMAEMSMLDYSMMVQDSQLEVIN